MCFLTSFAFRYFPVISIFKNDTSYITLCSPTKLFTDTTFLQVAGMEFVNLVLAAFCYSYEGWTAAKQGNVSEHRLQMVCPC